jgi:hypothetical protein
MFSILDIKFNEELYILGKKTKYFLWNTTCRFQNYIEKVDWEHYIINNCCRVNSSKHTLHVWQGQWYGRAFWHHWQKGVNFIFVRQCYEHFHYGLTTHITKEVPIVWKGLN